MAIEFPTLRLPSFNGPSLSGIKARFEAFKGKISSALQSIGRRNNSAATPLQNRHVASVDAPKTSAIKEIKDNKALSELKQELISGREKFEPKVLTKEPTLEDLPSSVRNSPEYRDLMAEFSQSILSDVPPLSEKSDVLKNQLAPKLNAVLNRPDVPYGMKLGLTLGEGSKFMESLFKDIIDHTPAAKQGNVGTRQHWLKNFGDLQGIYDRATENLGDKAEGFGTNDSNQRKITVNGVEYHYSKTLGSGNFGDVQLFEKPLAPNATEEEKKNAPPPIVVKIPKSNGNVSSHEHLIDGPAKEGRHLVNATGTGASAEYIIPFKGAVRTDSGELLLILGEAKHGTFLDAPAKIDAAVPKKYIDKATAAQLKLTPMVDLAKALERLQLAKGQVHFDVARRNMLIDKNGTTVLADFGLAAEVDSEKISEAKAIPDSNNMPIRWTAPERLRHDESTTAADSWSFGMTLWETVYNSLPFVGRTNNEVVEFVGGGTFDPAVDLPPISAQDWPNGMDVELRDLMTKILNKDPAQRPSMDEIIQHPALNFGVTGKPEGKKLLATVLSGKDPRPNVASNTPLQPNIAPPQPNVAPPQSQQDGPPLYGNNSGGANHLGVNAIPSDETEEEYVTIEHEQLAPSGENSVVNNPIQPEQNAEEPPYDLYQTRDGLPFANN